MQYGQSTEQDFFALDFLPLMASPMTDWSSQYQFASIFLQLGQDLQVTERSTYSVLDLLGDVGGLFDALRIMGSFLVLPFASTALGSSLMLRILSL